MAARESRGSQERSKEEEGESSSFLGDLPTLILAICLALFIRAFLFQSFYVPSDSMFPTLLVGDHVFVNKFVYGPELPFTSIRLPGLRKPKRGEVIVFHERPDLPREAFVKRLIGLPGDRVAYRNERLILNGEPVPVEETGRTFTDETGRVFDVEIEDLPGCRHAILKDPQSAGYDMDEIVVKPGRFLFLGDNRDNSYDGRRFGTVQLAAMAGPAGLLYWSWDWNGRWLSLLNPLTWWRNLTQRTRWSRMGHMVQCLPAAGG
jgi:signal peptidase I